ncbi:MAG: hypothetical protein Q8N96_14385 [Methylovulum sp.]|nr:hypothetical protein [Methylovulum sp.]
MQGRQQLMLPWAMVGMMLVMLAAMLIICHMLGNPLQQVLPEGQRVLVRTVLYGVAIVTFPLTNLIRHIQLRLNQTMPLPGTHGVVAAAKGRYVMTTIISMALIETPGIYGFVLFILGDNFNTLYLFTGMSALGLFLYRPKMDEFNGIIEALTHAER